jgi:hypothetical protein
VPTQAAGQSQDHGPTRAPVQPQAHGPSQAPVPPHDHFPPHDHVPPPPADGPRFLGQAPRRFRNGGPPTDTSLISKVVNGRTLYYAVETAPKDGRPVMLRQTFLGTVEAMAEAAEARKKRPAAPAPDSALVLDFGAVAALMHVADLLGLKDIIDRHVPRRSHGPSVGTSLLLTAIHRAASPKSGHAALGEWFERTVLTKTFPEVDQRSLGGHGHLENMVRLDQAKADAIDLEVANRIAEVSRLPAKAQFRDAKRSLIRIDPVDEAIIERGTKAGGAEPDLFMVSFGFSYLLAHNLCKVLNSMVKGMGHNFTIPRMIKSLANAQQVVVTYHARGKAQHAYAFSRLRGVAKECCDQMDLRRYALP